MPKVISDVSHFEHLTTTTRSPEKSSVNSRTTYRPLRILHGQNRLLPLQAPPDGPRYKPVLHSIGYHKIIAHSHDIWALKHDYAQTPSVQLALSPPPLANAGPTILCRCWTTETSFSRLAPCKPCCRYRSRSISTMPLTRCWAIKLAPAHAPNVSIPLMTPPVEQAGGGPLRRARWAILTSILSTSGSLSPAGMED
jgi:hypothetical protein